MKFESVLSDIRLLVGKNLNSIKPGANIQLTAVDSDKGKILLTDASNKEKTRSIEELRRIWEALSTNEVVHVDSVLGGSGSSRNQPETILANLPYIEWLILSNKKHLRLDTAKSRQLGTLGEMDPVAVHLLKEKLDLFSLTYPSLIYAVPDTKSIAAFIENLTGVPPSPISNGTYRFAQRSGEVWVTSEKEVLNAAGSGVYVVVKPITAPPAAKEISIGGRNFFLLIRDGLKLLLTKN
jgi:hypothetical protein